MPRAAESDLGSSDGENLDIVSIFSFPGPAGSCQWHDGTNGAERCFCDGCRHLHCFLCLLSKPFENVPFSAGPNRPPDVCRHGMIHYLRESNHPCSAMTGDHPNPLRRRSRLLLRDPTAAASGQQSSD